MFQAFWMGTSSCVSGRVAADLESWAILNGPSHMVKSLCNPSLESTASGQDHPPRASWGERCGSGTATAPAGTSQLGARLHGGVPPLA